MRADEPGGSERGRGEVAEGRTSKPGAHVAVETGVAAGFEMAAAAGPLCACALWGVAFELEIALFAAAFDGSTAAWAALDFREGALGPLSGQARHRFPSLDRSTQRTVPPACRRSPQRAVFG